MDDAGMVFLLDAVYRPSFVRFVRFPLREEFADSHEHLDRVPLVLLANNIAGVAVAENSSAGSGCSQQVGDDGTDTAQAGVRRRPDTSRMRSGRVYPQAPGWTKRLRLGSAPPDRTPRPSRMSALEQSIHKYAKEPTKSVVRPTLGLSFDSLGEAYDFYNLYPWEIGFGIRYGKSSLNAERTKCMQEIVCRCSGKPATENSRSCRCECPALSRLLRAADNSWYITEHRESHKPLYVIDDG